MSRLAREHDSHAPRGAVDGPLRERHMAEGEAGHIVQGEGEVRCDLAKARVSHDGCRTGTILFRRLEHQDSTAALRSLSAEFPRQSGENGHVAVMPAQMAFAWCGGAMRRIGDFLDRQ